MKLNKWVIFSGLKMVELLGITFLLWVCYLIGGMYMPYKTSSYNQIFLVTIWGALLMVISIVAIACVSVLIYQFIQVNLQWAEKIQERLRK